MSAEATRLRHRLNDPAENIETAVSEALQLFSSAGLDPQVRWLRLELRGYQTETTVRRLHELFGVVERDRLVAHVAAYRVQSGRIVDGSGQQGGTLSHFFVEPVRELIEAGARVRSASVSGPLVLSFGPEPEMPSYPREAEFAPDVFERVLLGLRATLHLQLGLLVHSP